MTRTIAALGLAMSIGFSGSAFAAACPVVGTWFSQLENSTFTFTTNKKGTSANPNQLCNNEKSVLTTTLRTKKAWNFNISSKNCPVVATAMYTFATGSCTSATGSISIPGVGTFPDAITKQ